MKSPYFKRATSKITKIEISIERENESKVVVAWVRPEKIKELVEKEKFIRELTNQ